MNIFSEKILASQVALVTGASRGIGRATAIRLAEAGASVALIGRDEAALSAAEREISDIGGTAKYYVCDVADFEAVGDCVKKVGAELGDISILVNNAGITRDKLIMQMSESDFGDVVSVNLAGCFNMIRHVSRSLIRRRAGSIINISSVAGLIGNTGQANYAASKAGMIGLTKSAARELAPRGITVNAIAPGFVETDMTSALPDTARLKDEIPLGRMAVCDEVANLVLYLASPAASYITGEVIRIDGGLAI